MRYISLCVLALCMCSYGVWAQGSAAGKSLARRLLDNAKNSSYQNAAKRFLGGLHPGLLSESPPITKMPPPCANP